MLAALGIGLVLFMFVLATANALFRLTFGGRMVPGISMAAVDLSNLTPGQAVSALKANLTYPEQGKIIFQYGSSVWEATPQDLGLIYDFGASVQNAYSVGRLGTAFEDLSQQIYVLQHGMHLAPVAVLDERVAHGYLQNLAIEIDQPEREADLHLVGTTVVYIPGQVGRQLDVDATLAGVVTQLEAFQSGQVPLVVEQETPRVLDASFQAQVLKKILSAPLSLTIADPQPGDPGPWTFSPKQVAAMISIQPEQAASGWSYQISANTQPLNQLLTTLAPQLNQAAVNPRFHFANGQLQLIQPGTPGRILDIHATLQAVTSALGVGSHTVPLSLTLTPPQVPDNATAQSLGISGLVENGEQETFFRTSKAPRIENIITASRQFDGLLIPPHTTFSMGDAIGDISLQNGYEEALIIYNGQSIAGVGGGVCQVSTTLFRTALYSGYPIVERHAHAYLVYYYQETASSMMDPSLAGLDATVYFPLVDLKFTNDRPYWLLMETTVNLQDDSLTWDFYSTNDGRVVNVSLPLVTNVVPAPAPSLVEDDSLAAGEMKIDEAPPEPGEDVTVTRTVSLNNQLLFPEDVIFTHYEAWGEVCGYGPGTLDPQALAVKMKLCQ
jgi:vancomycin resistance protein YoaR